MTQKKKDFTAATAAALGEQRSVVAKIVTPTAAAPTATPAAPSTPAAQKTPEDIIAGLPKRQLLYTNFGGTEVRVTFMLTQRQYEQIRRICFAQNTKQKYVFQTAVQDFIDDYEAKNGKLL